MEYHPSANKVLQYDITKLDNKLIPLGFQGDLRSTRMMQDSLSKVIDMLGEQSAAARGLKKLITTADKLRNSPGHTLYLLKDAHANRGCGEVIGLLKVGRKRLFLYDELDKVREVEPLCVLDFYVVKDRQRNGHGRLLFDYMLQDMKTDVTELAVDGPSPKMEQFLARNYGQERLVHQNNNFAISPQFFAKAEDISKSGRSSPAVTPVVGRFAASKPPSAIATVIHGAGPSYQESSNNGRVSGRASPVAPVEAEREPERKPTARPSTLQVGPVTAVRSRSLSPSIHMGRRDSQLTEKGYFDMKFYHNKLW